MSNALIFSTWGSPSRWGCAEYVKDCWRARSCSPLPLLTSKYCNSDVVLIVLDSLVDKDKDIIEKFKEQASGSELSTCGVCYAKCWEGREPSFSKYEDLENFVKDLVKCIVNCIYEHDIEEQAPIDKINVIVGPSIGSPGKSWKFEGGIGDFMGKVLLETGLLLDKLLSNGKRIHRVVFDLTHGMNFVPSAMLYLARMISSLMMVRQPGDLVIEVYNSDPYPPWAKPRGTCREAGEVPELKLNMVYRETAKNVYVPHTIPGNVLRRSGRPPKWLEEKLDELNMYLSSAQYVVSSIYYPLPLPLIYSCQDFPLETASDKLKDVLKIWREYVEINEKDKVVNRSFLELQVGSIYSILLAYFTCKSARKIIGDISSDYISLGNLANLKDHLYNRINEINGTLFGHELSSIETKCEELKSQGLRASKLGGPGLDKARDPNKRIMIAHAGFQEDFTVIQVIKENECLIGYSDELKEKLREECKEPKLKCVIKKAGLLLEKDTK